MKPLIAAAALILSAAVATTTAALADGSPGAPDFGSADWQLVTLDDVALKAPVTLNLGEAGRVTGQAPCNRFFGGVEIDGMAVKFAGLGATMMACEYLEDEHAFLTALQGTDMVMRDGDTLTFSGGGHVLVFAVPK